MGKNVLLLNPPQPECSSVSQPIGLMYLAGVLQERGHTVKIIDCPAMPNCKDINTVITQVAFEAYDVVGITIWTPFVDSAYACVKEIRKHFKGKIIAGGPHCTALKGKVLEECNDIDVIVIGEGESVITDVVENNTSPIIVGTSIEQLDVLPFPNYTLVKENNYHDIFGTQAVMITSRGCIYNCIFCDSDKNYRARSPNNVVDEIQNHVKEGRTKLTFYDDNMALDRVRLVEICNEILKRGLKIRFKMETRVNLVDKDLLQLLKKAGCYVIAYGIESSSQKVLNFLRKGITVPMVETAVRLTQEAGIQVVGYFILGSPLETKEDMLNTIDFAIKLDVTYAQFAILSPLPNTALWDYVKDNDLFLGGPISYFGKNANPTMRHPTMSPKELKAMVGLASKKFYMRPKYVIKMLKTLKSLDDVKALIRGLKMVVGG